MDNIGFRQGYYMGLFGRFVWFLLIYFIIQSMMIYIFDYNWFTYWALSIIFSFLINTSLPVRESYPFIRHIIILLCLLFALSHSVSVLNKLHSFFYPNWLWIVLMIISFLFGVSASFGRYGNGTNSKNIESFSNFLLFIFLILSFVLFWWKGGLVYLLFRIAFMFMEVVIAKYILLYLMRKNEKRYNIET